MSRYIGARVVQLIVIIFFISIVAFLLVHLLPGDPTIAILGPNDTAQARAELLRQLGLNKSLPVQYWTWIAQRLPRQPGRSPSSPTRRCRTPSASPSPSTSS